MPCKTASEEINNKLQYSKTHIYIFHNRLLGDVSVILEIKFLNFNESIRILLEGSCHVSCNYTYQNFWNENKYEITMDSQFLYYRYEEKQSNGTRNMKNVSFVPKGVQGIYHHIKFWKSIMS